jgi:hypothetical protein
VKMRRASWLRYKKSVCAGSFISKTPMTLRELRPCSSQAKFDGRVGWGRLGSRVACLSEHCAPCSA